MLHEMIRHWFGSSVEPKKNPSRKVNRRKPVQLSMEWLEERIELATLTWTGAVNNLWSNSGNWLNESNVNQAPTAGDDLIFATGASNLVNFNDLLQGINIRSITFAGSGSNYVLTGNGISLGDGAGGGIFQDFTSPFTVQFNLASINVQSGNPKFISVATVGGTLNVASPILLNGGVELTIGQAVNGDGNVNMSGVINGTGSLIKNGGGILALAGANNYTGHTTIIGGTLHVFANNVIPNSSAVILASAGATLDVDGKSETIGSLTGVAGTTVTLGNGSLIIGSDNGSGSFEGIITGTGTLTKIGSGIQTLTGNNLYTGLTTVSGGTLLVNGTHDGAYSVTTGASLGGTGTVTQVTLSGGSIAPGGATPGTFTVGSLTIQANSGLFVRLNGTDPGSFDVLNVTSGNVDLNNAFLNGSVGFDANIGDSFTILTTSGNITGTFSQGNTVFLGGKKFSIAYNDHSVVLTRIAANSTTTLTSSLNPSVFGDIVTFTIIVQTEAGTTTIPSGTVTIFDGDVELETVTLNAQGQATFSTDALAIGSHPITAKYNGSTEHEESTSDVLTQNVLRAAVGGIFVFAGSPQSTTVNQNFAIALQARVVDVDGEPLEGVVVTFSVPGGAGPSGNFGGQNTVTAVTDENGIATAPILTANTVAGNFAVLASVGSFSATFSLTNLADVATKMLILQQPTSTHAGQPISPAVRVALVDQFNNITNSNAAVTVMLGANPGGGTLSGTLTVNAAGGIAEFSDLSINKSGTGYTLIFKSNGFDDVGSNAFNITGGEAVRFGVSAPTRIRNGFGFEITVTAFDAFGNIATGYTGTVSFSSTANGTILPANYTFTASDAGVKRFTITTRRVGFQAITIKDIAQASPIPAFRFSFWSLFGNRLRL